MIPRSIAAAVIVSLAAFTHADDWPRYRGPRADGVSREKNVLAGWPESGDPKVLWRAKVGKGHSAVSVSNGKAYTAGWDGRRDTVYCFDAATGELVWKQSYDSATIVQWPGPRATPAVHGSRVYALGQHGQFHCYDAVTGKPVWSRQLPKSCQPDEDYGFAWSPLIVDGLVILGAGKNGLAFRADTGAPVWGDVGVAGSCASVVPRSQSGGTEIVVVANNRRDSVRVVGVDARSGKELWRSPEWPEKWGAACVDPLIVGDSVFLTTAEQHAQSARFTIKDSSLVKDWSTRKFACYTGGCVHVGGCVFGVNKAGLLTCLDWPTGNVLWSERGFDGHGTLIAAGDVLFVQASRGGHIAAVRATRDRYDELRRFQVFPDGTATFTAPSLANGRLYCRSYDGEVAAIAVGKP